MESAPTENTLMGGRVKLLQPRRGYRIAVDAVLLAAAVDARPGESVLDLGAGVGAVGLCIGARVPGCGITGIELQPALAALAERNAVLNDAADRVRTLVHDLADSLPPELSPFDHVVTNPPYLAAAVADPSPDRSKALATVESSANLARWLTVATGALKPAGTLLLIHRSDRLEEIVGTLAPLGWGDITVKRLPPAARVLVRARPASELRRRDAAPLVLHRPGGGYTDEAEAILRHGQPLAF
ncbi:tRNA1(Val) (adenine(37)-N6)-methyltransferase [Reyranella sp.]|uniref:tRNA1(Val) (adenine(37)-N6)-methyltransferase n=1 Tax=Reyranella sp. TaxID=1929291 RepID=UPI003C7D083E